MHMQHKKIDIYIPDIITYMILKNIVIYMSVRV
jgi:hypothetical protein